MDLLRTKRHYITPYHPQVFQFRLLDARIVIIYPFNNNKANGLDERWNQTLKKKIVKFTTDK